MKSDYHASSRFVALIDSLARIYQAAPTSNKIESLRFVPHFSRGSDDFKTNGSSNSTTTYTTSSATTNVTTTGSNNDSGTSNALPLPRSVLMSNLAEVLRRITSAHTMLAKTKEENNGELPPDDEVCL